MATFTGTNADETITPGFVSPTVGTSGGAFPGAAADTIDGEGGNDTLHGGGGNDAIDGGAGDDLIFGEAGNDDLLGGNDDDELTGGAGDDTVDGGGGDDRIVWNDGDGSDVIEGGGGIDTVEVNGAATGESFVVTANGTRVFFQKTGVDPFSLDIGASENLLLNAGDGNDTLIVTGNLSALIQITVDGGAGADALHGGNGADLFFGGDGNDFVDGNQGNDLAFLGDGNDTFQWDPGDGSDTVEGGAGIDRLAFHGSGAIEFFDISANGEHARLARNVGNIVMDMNDVERIEIDALGGADTINANSLSGTDIQEIRINLAGTVGGATGDAQIDTVIVQATDAGDTITVSGDAAALIVEREQTTLEITTIEVADAVHLLGFAGDDTIDASGSAVSLFMNGGANNDTLTGGGGGDTIDGGDGNDTINGGGGADIVLGAGGNDTLSGGDGADSVHGDDGNDTLVWNPGDDSDFMEGGEGIDTVQVNGGDGAEVFTLTANGERVRFDRLDPAPFDLDIGTSEKLELDMNGGDDSFSVSGNIAALIQLSVDGGAGDDLLKGGGGADTLIGGEGNDVIVGQQGADLALLGDGDDVFSWNPGDGSDIVEGDAGLDTLVLNGNAGAAHFEISANADRVSLFGNIGPVTLDLDGVEHLDFNVVGGSDAITVNDLSGTDVTDIDIFLAGTIGGDAGDGQVDTVTVNGTGGDDTFTASSVGTQASIAGLGTSIDVFTLETTDVVIINGLAGDDTMTTGFSNGHAFVFDGGAGNDALTGGSADDTLIGGDGDDTLAGLFGADTMIGGDGNDIMIGEGGTDTLIGGGGDDTLAGGVSDDTIMGGDGNDTITDGNNNSVDGGAGDDVIINTFVSGGVWDGGDGIDTLDLSRDGFDTVIDLSGPSFSLADAVFTNFENVIGTSDNDAITGSADVNVIDGFDGDDAVNAGDGTDTVAGGEGNDFLAGGAGADTLDGGEGSDTASFMGGNGVTVNLLLGTAQFGHAQGDMLTGFENLSGSNFFDELTGDLGANFMLGLGGNDFLNGSSGDDQLFGGDGKDLLFGGAGADRLNGGSDIDTANYSNSDVAVQVNLATGVNAGGHAEGDQLGSIEIVTGSSFADTLAGGTDAETFNGGNGADTLVGSLGADRLHGNQGLDTADFSGSGAAVNVNLLSGVGSGVGSFAEGDLFTGVENAIGSAFGDILTGTTGANVLEGGEGADSFNASLGADQIFGEGGDDLMVGGSGADAFDGGTGSDWVFYSNAGGVNVSLAANTGSGNHATGDTFVSIENLFGSVANDVLTGNADANTLNGHQGNDTLNGLAGDDVLLGGVGNDFLNGGPGDDVLSGGAGFDTFFYNLADFGEDTIIGFEDGVDMFHLGNTGLTFADFTETAAGSGTRLTLTAGPANTILILGVAPGLIDAGDFV